jgi:hypothetical protein
VNVKIIFFMSVLLIGSPGNAQEARGVYSHAAIQIWGTQKHNLILTSPDGAKQVVVGTNMNSVPGEPGQVSVRIRGKEYRTEIGGWVNSELGWAPDSKAFFVTYSDGGNVGTYHVRVFSLDESGPHENEPIADGRKLMIPKCFDPEYPNVGAIKWVGDSSHLLIAVEVPPHSSCASMGTFRAFEIRLPEGTVLRSYNQLEAKKVFARELGVELTGADDSCIRQPNSCTPPGLDRKAGTSLGTGR